MFNAALQDLEGLVTTAKRRQCKRLVAHGVEKSAAALEDGRGPCESLGGKEDSEDGVAAGVGKGAAFPQGDVANARLIQGKVGGEAQVEGLRDLFPGQSHSLGSAQRAGNDAQGDVVKPAITHAHHHRDGKTPRRPVLAVITALPLPCTPRPGTAQRQWHRSGDPIPCWYSRR